MAADYDDYADLFQDKLDEVADLFRGIFRAGLEGFRVVADSASEFSEDVLDRDSLYPDESARDAIRRFPGDISRSITRALDRSFDAPREAVNRFERTYRDEGRRHRRRVVEDEAYADWSTSDLRREAHAEDIAGADEMSRSDLLSALERDKTPTEATTPRTTTRTTTTETPPR